MSYYRPLAQDVLLDEEFDLRIENGDFVVGESDQQHTDHILLTAKGNWREWPVLGVNLNEFLNSRGSIENRVGLLRRIRLQLEYDNMEIKRLDIARGSYVTDIGIEAKRKK